MLKIVFKILLSRRKVMEHFSANSCPQSGFLVPVTFSNVFFQIMIFSVTSTTSSLLAETPPATCPSSWTSITFDFANQATLVNAGHHPININLQLENVHRLKFGSVGNMQQSITGCIKNLKVNRQFVSPSETEIVNLEGNAEFGNCPFS